MTAHDDAIKASIERGFAAQTQHLKGFVDALSTRIDAQQVAYGARICRIEDDLRDIKGFLHGTPTTDSMGTRIKMVEEALPFMRQDILDVRVTVEADRKERTEEQKQERRDKRRSFWAIVIAIGSVVAGTIAEIFRWMVHNGKLSGGIQ